jgi:Rrf2 family protein
MFSLDPLPGACIIDCVDRGQARHRALAEDGMRLSRKADYALRVMLMLVDRKGDGPISLTELAKKNDVPKRFLEHIMLSLKTQGWVASTAGRAGGYVLALPPERITLGQIIRHFDGVVAPVGCVSTSDFEPCSQSSTCRFRRVLLDIRNLTAAHLDNATLARVSHSEPVADQEVFKLELISGDGI